MFLENIDMSSGKQTEFLLKSISSRLSGREDCKGVEYEVIINHNGVSMIPLVYVYKNRYRRKDTDKLDVVSFVHQYKMRGALLSNFIFGTYRYELSLEGKRRKWRKVD